METGTFRGAACGPRRFGEACKTFPGGPSSGGAARWKSASVHSGFSASALGFLAIAFDLLSMRPPQADGSNRIVSYCKNQTMGDAVDHAPGAKAAFAVVDPLVFEHGENFDIGCTGERNAVLGHIRPIFFGVEFDLHFSVYTI